MPLSPTAAARGTARDPAQRGHVMKLFEAEEYLVESVRSLIEPALAQGRAGAIVATADHLQRIEAALQTPRLDLDDARAQGRYRAWDADELLPRLFVDGAPESQRFADLIATPVSAMADQWSGIAVYCELEAMAWSTGDGRAALEMEHYWTDLLSRPGCERLCAYPTTAFARGHDDVAFDELCDLHSRVIPSEAITGAPDETERLRRVAALEQQAAAATLRNAELATRNDQIERALGRLVQRDRARNEFVAMVSKDLSGSVATVSALVAYLRDHWPVLGESEVGELSNLGMEMTGHIEQRLDDLMTVAALEAGEVSFRLEPVHMAAVVRRARDLVKRSTGREVHVRIATGLPTARADEARQAQILGNLLANALVFAPRGKAINVALERRGEDLVVSVADQGHAISHEEAQLLFRPFARLPGERRHQRGSGLGLYLSKLLVEGQGGSIWVRTDRLTGTTFSYTVPIWPEHRR